MPEKSRFDISQRNVYDDFPYGFGETPASGTPGEIGLDARRVDRQDQIQDSIDGGELGEIAREFIDEHEGVVGFQYKGPKQVRMFVANHAHGIRKTVAAGAVSVAGIAVSAAIAFYIHHKDKQE